MTAENAEFFLPGRWCPYKVSQSVLRIPFCRVTAVTCPSRATCLHPGRTKCEGTNPSWGEPRVPASLPFFTL